MVTLEPHVPEDFMSFFTKKITPVIDLGKVPGDLLRAPDWFRPTSADGFYAPVTVLAALHRLPIKSRTAWNITTMANDCVFHRCQEKLKSVQSVMTMFGSESNHQPSSSLVDFVHIAKDVKTKSCFIETDWWVWFSGAERRSWSPRPARCTRICWTSCMDHFQMHGHSHYISR